MKTKNYFLLLFSLLLLIACTEDELSVNSPSFNVVDYVIVDGIDTLGNPVKKVIFNLEGNADVISFYSGETFHQYEYKDGRIVATDALNMSFEYFAALGTGTIIREDQLSVVVSTDFNGELTEEAVENANWTDITERFSLLQVKDITAQTATSADISDLATIGEPLYVAFRYITPPQTTDLRYCTWDIFDFNISQESILGNTSVVSQREAALPLVTLGVDDADTPGRAPRSVSTTSRLRFRGNILAANLEFESQAWAISPAIDMADDVDLGPDEAINIKTVRDPDLTTLDLQT